jgi:hypothetical protein
MAAEFTITTQRLGRIYMWPVMDIVTWWAGLAVLGGQGGQKLVTVFSAVVDPTRTFELLGSALLLLAA